MATVEAELCSVDLMRLPQAVLIPWNRIEPDPDQPREKFDEKELRNLAGTIRKHGLHHPISVRNHPEKEDWWMLVAGERRWRACGILGLDEIAAFILDEEEDFLLFQSMENLQRVDLDPMEVAGLYERLRNERGWNQNEIAQFVGKSSPHVSGRLQLLRLPPSLKERVAGGTLKITVALEILRHCRDHFQMIDLVNDILARTRSYGSIGVRSVQAAVAKRDRLAVQSRSERRTDSKNKNGIPLRDAAEILLEQLENIVGKQGRKYPHIRLVQDKWLKIPEARRVRILNYLEQIKSRASMLSQFLRQLGIDDDPYDDRWDF